MVLNPGANQYTCPAHSKKGCFMVVGDITTTVNKGTWDGQMTVRGSISVWLSACLTSSDSAAQLMFNQQKRPYPKTYLFGHIQTSQTGGQPYRYTSPNKVNKCSLERSISLDVYGH